MHGTLIRPKLFKKVDHHLVFIWLANCIHVAAWTFYLCQINSLWAQETKIYAVTIEHIVMNRKHWDIEAH